MEKFHEETRLSGFTMDTFESKPQQRLCDPWVKFHIYPIYRSYCIHAQLETFQKWLYIYYDSTRCTFLCLTLPTAYSYKCLFVFLQTNFGEKFTKTVLSCIHFHKIGFEKIINIFVIANLLSHLTNVRCDIQKVFQMCNPQAYYILPSQLWKLFETSHSCYLSRNPLLITKCLLP